MKTEGVRMDAYAKYKDAVSACGSMDYIDCNLSQVARKFGLKGPALANFMRVHFPQTLVWREEVRRWMGINDNTPRGLLPKYEKQYADAVKLYETSDLSISEIAALCGVSSGGFGQHLRFYHHDLLKRKRQVRKKAQEKERKAYGELSGNGHRYIPYPKTLEKYAQAFILCRDTTLTMKEIARKTGVSPSGLCAYLHKWHMDLVLDRSGISSETDEPVDLHNVRRRMKTVAAKYEAAIESLKKHPRSVAKAAAEFGLHPEVFREYLHKHEPELAEQQGMMRNEQGRRLLLRSKEKYAEAIRLYGSTTEDLKSIAARLGLTYNSVSGYIRRNHPEVIATHRALVAGGKPRKAE